jgi:hypothetical protein
MNIPALSLSLSLSLTINLIDCIPGLHSAGVIPTGRNDRGAVKAPLEQNAASRKLTAVLAAG